MRMGRAQAGLIAVGRSVYCNGRSAEATRHRSDTAIARSQARRRLGVSADTWAHAKVSLRGQDPRWVACSKR